LKLAIHNPSFTYPGGPENIAPVLAATARAAEDGGADQFTLMDHWFQIAPIGPPEQAMLEGYSGLAFVAAHTERMRLGLLVTGVTYRHPGLLAKTVTTLDVLSGGRAQLGIGAAWFEEEHDALGVPYPPIAERFERLEEAIQICFQMWDPDNDGPFEGKHYKLAETMCSPPPIQQPRPTLLIGGSGEKKTLKLVARYADACNLFGGETDVVAHKLDVLKGHCDAEGRDYAEIEKTIIYSGNPLDDVDAFLAEMDAMGKLGIDKVWVSNNKIEDPPAWADEVCAQTVTRLGELG
jgi:F420-dependent oxidoreductase-like protein